MNNGINLKYLQPQYLLFHLSQDKLILNPKQKQQYFTTIILIMLLNHHRILIHCHLILLQISNLSHNSLFSNQQNLLLHLIFILSILSISLAPWLLQVAKENTSNSLKPSVKIITKKHFQQIRVWFLVNCSSQIKKSKGQEYPMGYYNNNSLVCLEIRESPNLLMI